MKTRHPFLRNLTLTALIGAMPLTGLSQPQVLARVDDLAVTDADLEQALTSSPFGTQFPSMDRDDQAVLRGNMLRHLVISRLLLAEAKRLGLDQTPAFQQDIQDFRNGLLYRYYVDRLRAAIQLPEEVQTELKRHYQGDPDGLAATRSVYLAEYFRKLRERTIKDLAAKYHVRVHEDRIQPGITPATLLLEGDGLHMTYGDIVEAEALSQPPTPDWVKERLRKRGEMLLMVRAAQEAGAEVDERLQSYRDERLTALMLERKEQEWIPDEAALRAYFDAHPEIGRLLERRHIAQLVVATRKEAETLRRRILDGESLFRLAGELSIDPYARVRNGDMGWLKEGSGAPQIEQAIAELQDGDISEVIETPSGFHLVTIVERRPGGQRSYAGVRDKVRQLLIDERMNSYLVELEGRHQVVWNLLKNQAANASQ